MLKTISSYSKAIRAGIKKLHNKKKERKKESSIDFSNTCVNLYKMAYDSEYTKDLAVHVF
jgi:hypothetical protein